MSCLVSVIVPVHNTEQYLPHCIESVLNQSFTHFELLLIDDGSTDGSCLICDEYAERDCRVRVFHEKNGGVSSARNRGLDVARGEFIVFLDADDYVESHYLEHLMSSDADVVLTGMCKFGAKNEKSTPKEFSYFGIDELPRHWNILPVINYLYCFSTAKRFRAQLIRENGIRFNSSLFFSEDMCFNMLYYSHADTFAELPYSDYMYRIDNVNRNKKYKMSAEQVICHFEYLDSCFQQLYNRVVQGSLSFVRDDTYLRLIRKFYYFLMQDSIAMSSFVYNIRLFRRRVWVDYLLSLLQGKREKRVMREAVRFPYFTYCIEVRLRKVLLF